ncbi:hypothetical protein BGZ61DRAFT_461171 [Ilyonectria robusta]|uniref:uncharacterized protein n=1 Tax=Ilyonectria robusta TaxID=1079257 RepID=UPI001E8D954B|nr:uncharacterized protein BGZ61DRAFT_461171 [Ilyonectria robusta]KAH8667805.1 hypothetical protein BGZ61DRAFT_461171 [Ilyonectria robusta]
MAPIDDSEWVDIDTDSDEELPPPPISMPKANPTPPPATPRSDASIQAVIVRCNADKSEFAPWSPKMISADDPIFSHAVPLIPGLIEVPLVFSRVGTKSAYRANLDNTIITYLHIDATSGFAPPQWQSRVGTVVVARKDKKPLLPHHMEGAWMYCDYISDLFGEGTGAPTRLYNRQAFEKWWNVYCEAQKGFRRGKGGLNDPNDWRSVKSPYEM